MLNTRTSASAGFSLVEVIVATGILTASLLAMAGVFTIGMHHVAGSSPAIIAREKAREAVESIHSARDTGELSWAKVRNTSQGGVFVVGAQPLLIAGKDGLVNTGDDGGLVAAGTTLETIVTPGPDGKLGTSDDVKIPLTDFSRELQITDLMLDADPGVVNPNLRQIKVIVKYKVDLAWRTYSLTTYVSSFK